MANLETTAAQLLEKLSTKIGNVAPEAFDAAVRFYQWKAIGGLVEAGLWVCICAGAGFSARYMFRRAKAAQDAYEGSDTWRFEQGLGWGIPGLATALVAVLIALIAMMALTSPTTWITAFDGRMGIVNAVLAPRK